MSHIDQKLLELYVLKDENALQQRTEIEQHLDECAGCRELYARMEEMYSGFFADMEAEKENTSATVPARMRKSLVQQHASPLEEIRANYEIERAPIRRAVMFVRRHPFVTTTMSLFVFGFFALLGIELFKVTEMTDENPNYYHYNTHNDKVEIFNKGNKLLWSIPGKFLDLSSKIEGFRNTSFVQIADIDGDGINEVITNLDLGNQSNTNGITIYNQYGTLEKQFTLNDTSFHFRNVNYSQSKLFVNQFTIIHSSSNKLRFIAIVGNGRSPNFLAVLDSNFRVVGKYWHFGNLESIKVFHHTKIGKDLMLLTGCNDISDMDNNAFSFAVILDPDKVVGDFESSVTRGFGLNKSLAELYYIRFPKTDMELATTERLGAFIHKYQNNLMLLINIDNGSVEKQPISFQYFVSPDDFHVREVKFNSPTESTHQQLKKEGKIHSTFNQHYLEDLKSRVEYWDGEKWETKATTIRYSEVNQ